MNTTPIPNFVYAIIKQNENSVKSQKLKQIIKRKEKSINYIDSPIVRYRVEKELESIRQKMNKIDNQINLYKP